MPDFAVNSNLDRTCDNEISFFFFSKIKLCTFVDVEERADAVAGTVKVIQSGTVKMLTGDNVDTGVVDRVWEYQSGQVDGSHKNSSVNVLLPLSRPAVMQSPRHIRRSV